MIYIADTNFLIRCWRDARHPDRLKALQPYLDSEIRLPWIVKAEFLRGAVSANQDITLANEFLGYHKTLWPDNDTLNLYAQLYGKLLRTNQMIGPHDLWIATCALQHKLPLLTRNANEFRRVREIQVVDYTV